MTQKIISKTALETILQAWGSGEIDTEKMQLWMLDNFEPDEFAIGQGESESIVEAMHLVMNEYELADGNKCLTEQYQLAITLINCSDDTFISRKLAFLRDGFCD